MAVKLNIAKRLVVIKYFPAEVEPTAVISTGGCAGEVCDLVCYSC